MHRSLVLISRPIVSTRVSLLVCVVLIAGLRRKVGRNGRTVGATVGGRRMALLMGTV